MNKPLCKKLQNIDSNKTVKFGVYKCYTEVEIFGSVQEKKIILRKQPLKMYCNRNLQTEID